MRDLQTTLGELRSCKTPADSVKLPSLFTELEIAVLNVDNWPSNFFQDNLRTSARPGLSSSRQFLDVLHFLNNNWEQLSSQQHQRLRNVLGDGFDKYQNWMGAFVTSEILGERYADEDALATLAGLGKTARLPARAAVPHGLETLARSTADETLRARAAQELRLLSSSSEQSVREEALQSLRKLNAG